ncbi:hypothetical protein BDB01DRAFT_783104 [Pilobolus umbonatus]|nr:hypothetical protein BDB01DRAFT_783104 [Pilobolus umbonatus]
MTYPSKSLRIMPEAYLAKAKDNSTPVDDSLMSPPLTPTEIHPCFYDYPTKRKQFIHSYARMAPYLHSNNSNQMGNDRTFALNVYRDLLLSMRMKTNHQLSGNKRKSIKNNMGNVNDCAKLDKPAVIPTKKRKITNMSDASSPVEADKQYSEPSRPKKKRVSSVLPTGKEAAMAFDAIDIDSLDTDFYPLHWVPDPENLNRIPVKVLWKGTPLDVYNQPYYHQLHHVEATMASTLRLSPIQYLRCKRTLILAARTLKLQQIPFTKSVAQKLCRVDVNKTSALWTAFGQLGWLDEC